MTKLARVIAFYLPQFHPIPENDEWWGKGFTEWTNVAKAKPLFRGHYQPRIPADLGFYDLRLPEVRIRQAELAGDHGVEAFCYYHYWFSGRQLLERPFSEVLESGKPDFPFCICWANQTWTGIWHGRGDRILIEQTYPGIQDHRAHFDTLLKAFTDSRYVRVDGKPVFVVYRPMEIPDVKRTMGFWQEMAVKAGLKGLYLVGVHLDSAWRPDDHGFDASITPKLPKLATWRIKWISRRNLVKRLHRQYRIMTKKPAIYLYKDEVLNMIQDRMLHIRNYPCLIPNWDNTPRSGEKGLVLHESTPELFRLQVQKAMQVTEEATLEHRLIFVKAWNEWAEGNYLEPDSRYGRAYLEVLKDEIFSHRE